MPRIRKRHCFQSFLKEVAKDDGGNNLTRTILFFFFTPLNKRRMFNLTFNNRISTHSAGTEKNLMGFDNSRFCIRTLHGVRRAERGSSGNERISRSLFGKPIYQKNSITMKILSFTQNIIVKVRNKPGRLI